MSVSMAVILRVFLSKKQLSSLMPDSVGQNAILDVTTEDSFLGEGHSVLEGVISPSVHPAEEKWSVGFDRHVSI